MVDPTRAFCTVFTVLALALSSGGVTYAQREGQRDGGDDRKPSLALKASPPVGFAPLRVRVTVDLKGGADDYVDLYCPSVEWDWGDDIKSESSSDCEPYERGKTSIQRHYSGEHVFRYAGAYRLVFRLKQKDRVISVSSANVQVRAGVRDDFGQ
jgi:hypothetical protein